MERLANIIENHPEYKALSKWCYASNKEIKKNKKSKLSRKAFNHLNKSIRRLRMLDEVKEKK